MKIIDNNFYKEYERRFRDYNPEIIFDLMISEIPDYMDTREGSTLYDANMPSAIMISLLFAELDKFYKDSFANTASEYWLEQRALERGLTRKQPTRAIIKGEFNKDVPIGSRFSIGDLSFFVSEKINNFHYKLTCEDFGSRGNIYEGDLLPEDFIEGLTDSRIVGLINPARDIEDIEEFRGRYEESLKPNNYGGNISDYKLKVKEIDGVGGVRVIPVWNGGGTVMLIIQNNEYKKPDELLISEVQEKVDPVKFHQKGKGIAPIGHDVLVVGVDETAVNVSFSLTFSPSYNFYNTVEKIKKSIDLYFQQLRKNWDKHEEKVLIRKSHIENIILDIDGVIDIENTMINGESKNIEVDGVPILGDVSNV